jgi:hypothetical protein
MCFAPQNYSHHIIIAESFDHYKIFPCSTPLQHMVITRAGAITTAAKAASTSREGMRKGGSSSKKMWMV